MAVFLYDVFVTPDDLDLNRLLIPLEAAIDYFPPLAYRAETYMEKIVISDPRNEDWHLKLTYDRLNCVFILDSKWKSFVLWNHLDVKDVILFYKPFPVSYNNCFLVEIVKRSDPEIIHEVKRENFLFQLPLTETSIALKKLFIPAEEVSSHFPVVGMPAYSHNLERLYFTDYRNREWCMKLVCNECTFELLVEEFIAEHNLQVGALIRFYKPDQPLHSLHFLIIFIRDCVVQTTTGPPAVGGGGTSSGGRRRWKHGLGGCCMPMRSNARTEES